MDAMQSKHEITDDVANAVWNNIRCVQAESTVEMLSIPVAPKPCKTYGRSFACKVPITGDNVRRWQLVTKLLKYWDRRLNLELLLSRELWLLFSFVQDL